MESGERFASSMGAEDSGGLLLATVGNAEVLCGDG